jgi:predicted  nucleic acid-binding Zn-ribbon protein
MENEKEKDMTLDDLARIVQNGFLKIDGQFSDLNADVAELKTDVAVLKADVAELKDTVNTIEANLNKKVDKIEYNTLEYRVERLEEARAT